MLTRYQFQPRPSQKSAMVSLNASSVTVLTVKNSYVTVKNSYDLIGTVTNDENPTKYRY